MQQANDKLSVEDNANIAMLLQSLSTNEAAFISILRVNHEPQGSERRVLLLQGTGIPVCRFSLLAIRGVNNPTPD